MSTFEKACAGWSVAERAALERVLLRALAIEPEAQRGVSYGVPALLLAGKALIGVSRAARHLSLVSFSPRALDTVRADLAGFTVSKGVVRFAADGPPPDDVLDRLIRARAAEIRGA